MAQPSSQLRETSNGTELDVTSLALNDPKDLLVNGKSERFAVATVADLLTALDLDTSRKGIAVALNGAVVPRRSWEAAALTSGDAVEIIHAKQGG
ncbi:sulfur carrier protein ThiS [Azorhizobium sp. AG788]|uniref:sulfur carrier protein ThiS n=1 Tax=Azorhizobium sp. AG788 TaxID=2183897 RepID=UPI00313A4C82